MFVANWSIGTPEYEEGGTTGFPILTHLFSEWTRGNFCKVEDDILEFLDITHSLEWTEIRIRPEGDPRGAILSYEAIDPDGTSISIGVLEINLS